jgi:hypothetical protein
MMHDYENTSQIDFVAVKTNQDLLSVSPNLSKSEKIYLKLTPCKFREVAELDSLLLKLSQPHSYHHRQNQIGS